ncbi:Vanillyl-alcohol oxidase [Pleurostoma richardsiae]|uniref:Vanillyl-alcohol oxidase n=1 Tax=Pleurostoma richardsiae TaxID=41990 RepID=A0AA38VHJ0_9PEZI|nr:Vanillyl-alcohol oxidase [Pleurostoma richardsiae]
MTSSLPTNTYPYADYEAAHQVTFAPPTKRPIKPVLPPGVQTVDFERALEELISILGKEAVFVKEALAYYIDPYELWEDDETKRKVPSAAVCPSSLGDLRQVLHIANKYGIPVWTFSRGKNLGYGGPAPRVSGSVALDLHRMNRILEVNDEFSYAVVEPGVSFAELYNYCVEHKKRVWPSTASIGWGSVLGNTLDRGTGFAAHSNHHQCMAGIEVMLADGDVIRTGQFGISNSPSAFVSKFTFGPSVEGLFLQSNLGVVTKLSIWMTPQPSAFMSCSFNMPEFEDLEVMVDTFNEMRQNGVIPNNVWVGSIVEGLCLRGRRQDFWSGPGPMPDWRIRELQKEHNMGFWTAQWGLYGPKRIIQAHFDEIRERLGDVAPTGQLSGKLFVGENGSLLDAKSVPTEYGNVLAGVPSLLSLPLMSWPLTNGKGKPAHGDYAPVIPSSGKRLVEWMRVAKPIYEAAGLELMSDFFIHERHVILTSMYTYDQEDPVQRERVNELYLALHAEAKKRGYGMYRAHVNHMDLIASVNDFNNHAYGRFVEKIKDALDPNGILSPGKQGIWPQRYRHLRDIEDSPLGPKI